MQTGLACFTFLLLWTQTVAGRTYYVTKSGKDTNAGTSETSAWLTVQKAANSATPGSTVYIGPGTYYETVTVNVQGNARDGLITFASLIFDKPAVISGKQAKTESADGTMNIIFIQEKSYLRFVNLELTDLKAVECSGVRITGAGTNVELRGLHIHDIRGGGQSGGAMPITVYNKDQTASRRQVIVDSCILHDCEPAWSEALTFNGNIEDFQVTNNKVYNMNNIGIDFIGGESFLGALGVRNGLCAYNLVWNIHSVYDSSSAGIYVDGASNVTIESNEVHHSDMGIEVGAENKGRVASKMTVRNNYLHHNDKYGLAFGGYDSQRGQVTNSLFINNRLEQNDVRLTGGGEISISFASGNVVYGNTIRPNSQNVILLASQEGGLNNQFDYQKYYPNGQGATKESLIFFWGNTEYDGLTSFQQNTKQEMHAELGVSKRAFGRKRFFL
ncbi:unnamed protein product [Adineta ricciae]|uniref:Right handed beta helix domain-containing protein n=1 Tax=Adineta ricciae TaxID=249248 RepID=A0A815CFI0_ADIRI|nr:unnamed protein product [Adineta ricciae]CAF1357663.1 unnamed protein product [Adineta ricciae]